MTSPAPTFAFGDAALPADAPQFARRLAAVVDGAVPALLAIDDDVSRRRPAPGKWSPREIIGHLIDSASNNHQRFVRMRARDDLVVDGYQQDEWVSAQRYQDAPWPDSVPTAPCRESSPPLSTTS